MHALVSRGGRTRDWEWVPVGYVDEHAAELLFRHKVMRLLQDVGLLTEERTELLLSKRCRNVPSGGLKGSDTDVKWEREHRR